MNARGSARRLAAAFEERRRRRGLNAAMDLALRAPPARAFARYGAGSHVLEPARVDGVQHIELGAGVLIHELSWLIAKPAPDGTPPRMVFEDGANLLRFLKVVCTGEVIVGARCLAGDHVYISDTGYRHDQPGTPIARQGLAAPHPVRIGADVHLGFAAKVLPGVTIGDGAYVGAAAVVTQDVPARGVVVGNPARVITVLDEAESAELRAGESAALRPG